MLWAIILIIVTNSSFEMPSVNIGISVTSGLVISVGLILYTFGAKYLPSGELVMLSLLEVVLGIFWAWLPILGIHEVPSTNTLIGGCVIVLAIISSSKLILIFLFSLSYKFETKLNTFLA